MVVKTVVKKDNSNVGGSSAAKLTSILTPPCYSNFNSNFNSPFNSNLLLQF